MPCYYENNLIFFERNFLKKGDEVKTSYYKKIALIPICVLLLFCNTLLPLSRLAYVVNSVDGTITPIDLITNTVYPVITVGGNPTDIAITADGKTAFVSNTGTNEVNRIDLTTNTVVANISTGIFPPTDVAISPDGKTVWVPAFNRLLPIDIATNAVGPAIIVGGVLQSIDITSDGIMAYVTSVLPDGVVPVNLQTGAVGTLILTGVDPFDISITPDNRTAYVTNSGSDTVSPIDLTTNTAGTPIPVGTEPFYVVLTPDGSRAYVTNYVSNTISVIDTATNTVIDTIVLGGGNPFGLAIDISGTLGLVGLNTDNTAQKFFIPINTLSTIYPVGTNPAGIAISPVPFPPSSFRGVVRANIFLDRTEYILEVTIGASTDPVQFYRIFRNGVLVLETSNLSALFCLGTSISVGGFSIASVLNGSQSEPVPLIIA